MRELIEIKEGDFVVMQRPYRYAVVRASKVTPLQIKASGEWSSSSIRTYQRAEAVFAGNEPDAKSLVEKLEASGAAFRDEQRAAIERHLTRNKELIDAASAARS